MSGTTLCAECGAPHFVTKHNTWLPNGTILEDNRPDHRVVFIESDSLRGTFEGVERIMGIPIESIIVESQRRSTYESVSNSLPGPLKAILKRIGTKAIIRNQMRIGKLNGKGDLELISFRRRRGEDDYIKLRIREPFSLPHFMGNFAGAFEAVDGREMSVTYKEIAPGDYELTGRISQHDARFEARLQRKPPSYKAGDIELPRCGTCGGPAILSNYVWHLDRGVIENRNSGRRMIIVSTATQEAIIDELINELGDDIGDAIVEAQRNLVVEGFFSIEEVKGVDDFRTEFAWRGLGNVAEIDFDVDHLQMRLENPCMNQAVAGLAQGLYEFSSGRPGKLEWEITEGGDLAINVQPKTVTS
jgi:hypothetical protein